MNIADLVAGTQRPTENSLNRTLFANKFSVSTFNFGMPFEVNNFAIRTWNVVLVFECRFVSENVVFVSEFCVLVVEESSDLEIYSFTFGTPLNSGILRSDSRKCRLCLRQPFLSQKAVVF